jgi:hypothetical protein
VLQGRADSQEKANAKPQQGQRKQSVDRVKRPTVEQGRTLDLRELARKGCFKAWHGGRVGWSQGGNETASLGWRVVPEGGGLVLALSYRVVRTGQDVEVRVPLETTRPHFSGVRWWGRCPCGRRAAKLHLAPGAVRFACRRCHGLTYASVQRHDARVDALRRDPDALRRILDDAAANPPGSGLLLALKAIR